MIRDRDRIYGAVVTRRLRAMGIRDRPITPASPWQNGFAERLIGSIRRECVDHMIVLGEAHLRRILKSYAHYYNENASILEQGCAGFSSGSANRCDQFTRNPRRTSPPLRCVRKSLMLPAGEIPASERGTSRPTGGIEPWAHGGNDMKRRHERRAGRNASEAIEPRDGSNPQADRVVLAGRQ
jgi:hypothetical protein